MSLIVMYFQSKLLLKGQTKKDVKPQSVVSSPQVISQEG
jgi:hypothetical protein